MIYIDMHLHSEYSKHPSEWFLQRIGTQESYTEIEKAYALARKRGMTFVTLTDHNTIEGAKKLHELHPDTTFISVEITTYFPENGCKIHVLAYDISEEEFEGIQQSRHNIYELRDFLKSNDIACSVAHATYSINGRLSQDILEKLILLFDVFEGINGSRTRVYNETWVEILKNLTPEHIKELEVKHRIEPWSDTPWIKGFTGGSDDHAGLMIGESYTVANCDSVTELIDNIKAKKTVPGGRYGDHKSLALAVYKIAYDFSKHKAAEGHSNSLINIINSIVFDDGKLGLKNWLALQRMKMKKNSDQDRIILRFYEEITNTRFSDNINVDEQVDKIYQSISRLADDYFNVIISSLERDVDKGDTSKILRSISAAIPALFLSAPFFTSMHHLNKNRKMLANLKKQFIPTNSSKDKKVLWFSDTVTDLNGVAVTMRNLAGAAYRQKRNFKLITSLPEDSFHDAALPANVINLPNVYTYTPDFYSALTLRFPSYLRAIDIIARENPDEIIISTPGPVGLLGLIVSRLLDIKCSGVYHTDFTKQAQMFIDDEWVAGLIETFTIYFYRFMDEILVPTNQYQEMLSYRGLSKDKMRLFKRGIDASFAQVDTNSAKQLKSQYNIENEDFVLMYSGRLGKEKNLGLLQDVYETLLSACPKCKLLIAGDGPEMHDLKIWAANNSNIILTGHVNREELPLYYTIADCFLFPSTTDTFGMAVLEAQACGLPALVTNEGGPQEIVRDGETGYVLDHRQPQLWVDKLLELVTQKATAPERYQAFRKTIMQTSQSNHNWDRVLDDIMTSQTDQPVCMPAAQKAV